MVRLEPTCPSRNAAWRKYSPQPVDGTSAITPLYAGLIAGINARSKSSGRISEFGATFCNVPGSLRLASHATGYPIARPDYSAATAAQQTMALQTELQRP